jgi:hypothetical protein
MSPVTQKQAIAAIAEYTGCVVVPVKNGFRSLPCGAAAMNVHDFSDTTFIVRSASSDDVEECERVDNLQTAKATLSFFI